MHSILFRYFENTYLLLLFFIITKNNIALWLGLQECNHCIPCRLLKVTKREGARCLESILLYMLRKDKLQRVDGVNGLSWLLPFNSEISQVYR